MNPDSEFVGRLTVVVVGQILHELRQVHSRFSLVLSEHAEVLTRGKRERTCIKWKEKVGVKGFRTSILFPFFSLKNLKDNVHDRQYNKYAL